MLHRLVDFSSRQTSILRCRSSAKLKAIKHLPSSSKITHFALQSAAPQQMNIVFVNSSITDKIQNKTMKFPGALLSRGIRSWSERFVLYCYSSPFPLPLACSWCVFDIRECKQQQFLCQKRFFLKSKFFQHFPLLKTTFYNICTCLPLILLSQRSTAVSLSLRTDF